MKSLRTMVAGVSIGCLTGSMSSCVSSNFNAYKARYEQQKTLINEEENIIKNYGVSTLQPNGKLSSIEENDVLYFNSAKDSLAYERVNKLSNGIINKTYAEGLISVNAALKKQIKANDAMNIYYNVFNKQKTTSEYLSYAYNDYITKLNSALKQSEKIRKKGRKMFCAFVRKNAKLIK